MNVIDVSKWQKTFDPRTAYNAGIRGVILRHAYGVGLDNTAISWANGVAVNGMSLGGYGFATWHYESKNNGSPVIARNLMIAQVEAWIASASRTRPDYWFAIDQELEAGQSMGIGKTDNTAILNEAADMLRAAGLKPCVYCSIAWDLNWIRTADLKVPEWIARYWRGSDDFNELGSAIANLPDGSYTRQMMALYNAGRLAGWQFGSQGLGRKYGCGSDSVDRNIFYMYPEDDIGPIQDKNLEPAYVILGPMSAGDLRTVGITMKRLEIPYSAGSDTIASTIKISAGDQATFIRLAADLRIPIQTIDQDPIADPTPDAAPAGSEKYTVVFLGLAIKGDFTSQEDAIAYVESILGSEAVETLGIKIQAAEVL